MNRNILIVVSITLIVSLIQISDPLFFFNIDADKDMAYVGENRNFSIYSWIDLNSLGITFPILISILVSVIDVKRKTFSLVVLSGIIVAFLSRARYVMISAIIAFSQLFFSTKITIRNKFISVFVIVICFVFLIALAEKSGFNMQQVIDERILEKESDMGSANARVTSYFVFLMKFPENPWFGVGPETRDDVVQLLGGEAPIIHVGYLSYLYFYGLIGFLLWFLTLFYLLRGALLIGKRYNFWGSFYGLISFCVANWTMVYFNLSEMGIIIAVIYLKYYKQKDSLELTEVISARLV